MIAAQPRIDQNLRARQRLAGIAQCQAQRCCEIATGTVTGHQHALRIELKGPGAQRPPDLQAIIERSGKRMLRCPAIIDGDHQHTECRCQFGADEIVGVQVPHHPAAAMQVNDARRCAGRWLIGTDGNAGQHEVDHIQPGGTCRSKRPAHLAVGQSQSGEAAVGAVETDGFLDECRHLLGKRVRSHEPGARSEVCVAPTPCRSELARDDRQR
ncbi:hypothetical protein D3C78_1376880 [compost metagenome]